jgi:hypothetical protein
MTEPVPQPALDAEEPLASMLKTLSLQVGQLEARVVKLENKLLLLPDLDLYGQLQDLLVAGRFKEADAETTRIILSTVGKKRDELSPEMIASFPCTVLTVIDRLWRNASQNRFGFGVQLAIYQRAGGTIDTLRSQDRKVMRIFAEEVGWLVAGEVQFDNYDQWDFSLSAPQGKFPAIWWKSPYGLKMVTFFFTRLLECNL